MSGVPVVTCLRAFFTLHARLRVRGASGIPCALLISRVMVRKTRADQAAGLLSHVLSAVVGWAKRSVPTELEDDRKMHAELSSCKRQEWNVLFYGRAGRPIEHPACRRNRSF